MGVVCRFVGSKRSETKRYVISNCPIMSRMKPVEPWTKKKRVPFLHSCLFRQKKPTGEMERMMGVEPTTVAWEATVLPLNYIRM